MNRNALLFVLTSFLVIAYLTPLPASEIYTWTDKAGTVHITDNPTDMPVVMPAPRAGKEPTDFPPRSPRSKKGWTRENLDFSIQGCVFALVIPSLESYREHASKGGHHVSDEEMKKVESRLTPIYHKPCKCFMEEIAKRWDYDESISSTLDIKPFLDYLEEKKVCARPVLPRGLLGD